MAFLKNHLDEYFNADLVERIKVELCGATSDKWGVYVYYKNNRKQEEPDNLLKDWFDSQSEAQEWLDDYMEKHNRILTTTPEAQ